MVDHAVHASGDRVEVAARLRATAVMAWCGLVGPAVFTVGFMAQELARRGEYSPMAEPVSALEAGPDGWLQQVNFVAFGLLTMAFAVGLHRGVRGGRAAIVGPALLFASGVGLLLAAALPLEEDAAGVTYDPGGHTVAGVMFFLASAAGLVALSRRGTADTRWRSLARYTLMAGIAAVLGFALMGLLVIPDDAPLHDWAGLGQRLLILAVIFPCRTALAWRLLRVSTGTS